MPCSEIYFLQERVVIWFWNIRQTALGGVCGYSFCIILCLSFTHIELTLNYS